MTTQTEDPAAPRIEVIPADEARGHCPTLTVDGSLWHDPVQPYRPVLALEGARPDVVAVFGLGLGYTAAGVLQLNPDARVVAWEPIDEVRRVAESLLRDEWRIDDRVIVEAEAADFQARLLATCRGARSLASLELPALREREPDRAREFRRVVQEVVDADTLTSLPGDAGAHSPVDVLEQLARHPRLMEVAGPWRGLTALLLAEVPDETTRAAISRRHGQCQIVTTPRVAPALARAGLQPDLVLVRENDPPGEEICSVLAESLIGVTPDSHPAWWTAPTAGRFVLGHSGTAWLLPEGDPGHVLSYRWGPEIPMAVAALTLGAKNLVPVKFERSRDAHWNWLAPSRRRYWILRRLAAQTGAEVLDWSGRAEELPEPGRTPELGAALRRADTLGSETLGRALDRSGRALAALRREAERMKGSLPPRGLAAYVAHRAEADPFTRSHVSAALNERLDLGADPDGDIAEALARAERVLERGRRKLGLTDETPRSAPAAPDTPLRVFVAGARELPVAAAVLEAQITRQAGAPVTLARLDDALAERFGPRARALPTPAQKLLIPALCGFEGRGLYVDPSVLVFGDVTELTRSDMAGAAAQAPLDGPASLLLVDAGRAGWDPEKVISAAGADPGELERLLLPSVTQGIGKLDDAWSRCDAPTLETAAVRLTCEPWMPWLSGHHPAAWAWEAMLAAALADGAVSPRELETAAREGSLRTELSRAPASLQAAAATDAAGHGAPTHAAGPLTR
jgi:hypothetical protein